MTAPALTAIAAVFVPAGTNTDAGTVRAEATLLAKVTVVPPAGAAFEMMTLQVVEAEAARLVVPHCRDVIEIGAVMERAAEAFDAPRVAVTVTF